MKYNTEVLLDVKKDITHKATAFLEFHFTTKERKKLCTYRTEDRIGCMTRNRRIGMPQWKRFEKQLDPISL